MDLFGTQITFEPVAGQVYDGFMMGVWIGLTDPNFGGITTDNIEMGIACAL